MSALKFKIAKSTCLGLFITSLSAITTQAALLGVGETAVGLVTAGSYKPIQVWNPDSGAWGGTFAVGPLNFNFADDQYTDLLTFCTDLDLLFIFINTHS